MTDQETAGIPPPNPYLAHLKTPYQRPVPSRKRPTKAWGKVALGVPPTVSKAHPSPPPQNRFSRRSASNQKTCIPSTPTPTSSSTSKPPLRPHEGLGNYQHYYSKRVGPHARVDPRLALFDPAWFREKKVLDVGCNAGFLTICVGQFMGPRIIEGVDIDIGLVRKARGQLVHRGSIAREEGADLDEVEGGGDAMDVVAETQGPDLDSYDYFPESAIYSYSEIPLIHHPTASATPDTQPSPSFPSNVTFRCGDWLHEPNPSSSDQIYDTLLALSVNKWIHLNHGDAGLKLFFRKSLNSLKKGGIFILEVQPFTSYRKRGLNLTEEMSNHYRQIKLKPEGFKVYLETEGKFSEVRYLTGGPAEGQALGGFARSVLFCRK